MTKRERQQKRRLHGRYMGGLNGLSAFARSLAKKLYREYGVERALAYIEAVR